MSDIPTEIYREILIRLPAETLLRFRCVCKEWRNTIDDPDFVRLHVCRQMGTEDMLMLRSKNLRELCSVSLDSFDHHHLGSAGGMQIDALGIRNVTSRGVPHELQFPIPTCHGLILIWNMEWKKPWIVWNPFLGDWLELPMPEKELVHGVIDCAGIGYDHATNDYKVVRLYRDFGNVFALIYSFKSNAWHPIENFRSCNRKPPHVFCVELCVGVFVNGALHWILPEIECILALDLTSETYRKIHLPSTLSELPRPTGYPHIRSEIQLCALAGCLFISYWYVRTERHVLDMWILKDYEGDSMWTKLVSYECPYDMMISNGMRAIAYIKSKEQVVFQHENRLKWLDMEKKSSKVIHLQTASFCSQMFPASLIRLTPHTNEGNTSKGKHKRGRKTNGNDRLCFRMALQALWTENPGERFV